MSDLLKKKIPGPVKTPGKSVTTSSEHPLFGKDPIYPVIAENWFTSKPYGFKLNKRNDDAPFVMFLPISPSNLSIQTNFATNIIPTLYGTVEEHSPVRYYDITIEGTTGMAPLYVDIAGQAKLQEGRAKFSVKQGLSASVGGLFSKTLGLIDKIKNQVSSLTDSGDSNQTGIYTNQTGYYAFHNLYRFLLKYKEDTAGDKDSSQRTSHPLTFFNYKDNNEYDVAIRSFTLKRSAENPMLYYYSIQMRGYNLRVANDNRSRLNDDDAQAMQKRLGLDGVDGSSLLGKIKAKANIVKGILGAIGGGTNILGR